MNSPEEMAKKFAEVRAENFLAHTIREIEYIIYEKHSINYLIKTRIHEDVPVSACHFDVNGCTIYLAAGANSMQDKEVRLRLAHELGHIVLNIDRLKSFIGKQKNIYSVGEEADAWEFAYYLLWNKSESYKTHPYKNFMYDNEKSLVASILRISNGHGNEVSKLLEQRLPKI